MELCRSLMRRNVINKSCTPSVFIVSQLRNSWHPNRLIYPHVANQFLFYTTPREINVPRGWYLRLCLYHINDKGSFIECGSMHSCCFAVDLSIKRLQSWSLFTMERGCSAVLGPHQQFFSCCFEWHTRHPLIDSWYLVQSAKNLCFPHFL